MIRHRLVQSLGLGAPLSLCALLVAAPIVLIRRFALPVPLSDHWAILGNALAALDRGDSWAALLWAQHNEHRLVVGRLADLTLLVMAGAPLIVEQYLLVLLGAAAGALVWIWTRRDLGARQTALGWWLLPLTAGLALSPAQMENWVSPMQVPVLAQNVAVVAGLMLLGRAPLRPWRVGLAAACGIAATGCFASGLLYWPAALIPLAAQAGRRRWRWTLAWLAVSAVVWTVYFHGYAAPPGHPAPAQGLAQLGPMAWFLLALLGNPIAAALRPQAALAALVMPLVGLLGLALLTAALVRLWRQKTGRAAIWPWAGLAAYTLLLAASITAGRIGMGFHLALSPRYITMVWPFWGAVVALALLALVPAAESPAVSRAWLGLRAGAGWLLVGGLLVVTLGSINSQVQRWTPIMRDRAAAVAELPDVCRGNAELVGQLGLPGQIQEAWPLLLRRGIVALPAERVDLGALETSPVPVGAVESVSWEEPSGPSRCLRVAGWAGSESPHGAAREVWLVSGGVVVKRAWVGQHRPHTGPDYDRDPHPASGWTAYLDTRRLGAGSQELEVIAVFSGTLVPGVPVPGMPVPDSPGAVPPRVVRIGKVSL